MPLQEAAWAVSNIAAGSILQKHTVFNGGVVPPLLHLLATAVFDVRKESAYCLGNLCVAPKESREQGGIILEHLITLVDGGCLPGFIALVRSPDVEAARLGLQFLELVRQISIITVSLMSFGARDVCVGIARCAE